MLKPVTEAPPIQSESTGISSRLHAGFHPNNRTQSHQVADSQLTREWLAEGAPIADVLTMIEVRRRFEYSPHFARAYAVEIVWAVWQENHTTNHSPIAQRKEPAYAVA
jgi:hypothetical protein